MAIVTRSCQNCGAEVPVQTWSKCPGCGADVHFKIKSTNGRIKKVICHPGGYKARVQLSEEG